MIRLIATDIDGTLVEDGTASINPEIYDIILKLREKGIQFAAASGRHWYSIENLFKPVCEKIFYISNNGAYIGMKGRNLFLYTFEKKLSDELISVIKENPRLIIMASGKDTYYTDTNDEDFLTWVRQGYRPLIKIVDDLTQVKEDFIKISAYSAYPITDEASYIVDRFSNRLEARYSGRMWLDCVPLGVDKGKGIKIIQQALGISDKETMVFGDQDNDVEMLKSSYYSYAVLNAVDSAKKAARFMADKNTSDGVLKILKLLTI